MKKSINKVQIIKVLLEAPHATGQIAIKLDYIDNNGYGIYKNITSDLKTLEQNRFIHRIKPENKRIGAPATIYDINYELPVLREILEKYPSLIVDLQKNERILSMLIEKHKSLLYPLHTAQPKKEELEEYDTAFLDEHIDDFKNSLYLSPTFFENCLIHESEGLKLVVRDLMKELGFNEYIGSSKMSLIEQLNKSGFNTPADVFYIVCKAFDRLKNKYYVKNKFADDILLKYQEKD